MTLRTYEELVRELIELEKQFPPPNESECFADARWFEERWGTAEFEPYRGTHVAVLNGTVVGHGRNSLQLRRDLVREHDIHPQRFIIVYIPTRGL